MAIYTHVDERTLARFLSSYNLGSAVAFKGIAEGVENSNYFLETEKSRLILTLYEKRADPQDLPYFLDLMQHLSSDGLPSPEPVKDKNGKALQTLLDKPACLISFLNGVSTDDPDKQHCAALGTMMARMHSSLSSFKQVRRNDLSISGWQKLIRDIGDKADTVKPGLSKIIHDEIEYLSTHWPENLPTGPIHADLFPDNVLFTGHEITGVIDFYFACTDTLAYDIAVCLNAWCFDSQQRFVPEKAKRLIEMYDATRSLSGAEVSALPILCRGAALRFLLTRLYDWLNPVEGAVVRPKDPIEYLAKLSFHQNVKDAATYVV
ncbi:homoserine kinase [Kordiimonas aquimaris]|uniref:homoserine kinase n=1 Tax=Kordiimonas aquimaris TaxID=707591 RepID=UPI0021CEFFBC|nr:homoserine kinase [Kordiimonas aquimaris]